ncbi:SusC/RagA family TonB-linked outer membrane protein [Flavobacterium granuli]|uniref:TonB-linked SusC/RagA family outer membrane protein n=1 Tax=Flavobacterium granuli TaxID=280093 RepID=A0A1M5J682_9FLAO|nr:TonB-dependent receptor [Flavobacterium granuli]PRZ28245.1 TonB-linked SusC/RagA family outer membrane protein [Flavobacterium granuli]SHG35799.1 TonB-linked outer membrane protein, SusC/RagA family [Flavobacterium granuli]
MKKTYLLLLFSFGCFYMSFAQTTIKGKVTSKTDGSPIPGVTVTVNEQKQNAISTDFDGNYAITVKEKQGKLVFTSIGYKKLEIPFGGNQTINISLEDEVNSLDEVVLIGYGSSKKRNITSAIASVDNIESISSRPVSTLNDFLQGSVAGVTVMQQGGDPSQTSNIVIRGYGSFANEKPLTVVDGLPYYGPPINPVDIKSVSILKDAAAAAIYGAQASSGVIVIETKNGKVGKPSINFDFYSGLQSVTNLPTALNAQQQADVYNQAADNGGSPRQSAHNAQQNPWGQITRTNWVDKIFKTAAVYNANFNISGASDNVNYMTSVGYNKKEGALLGTFSERFSFREKTDIKLSDKIKIGQNVYFSRTEAVGTDTNSGYSGAIINALYMPSAAPVYDADGKFSGVTPQNLSQFAGAYGDVYNPVALLLRPTTTNPTSFINANAYFNYNIIDGLSFKSNFGYSYTNDKYKRFSPRIPELGRTNLNNFLYQSGADTNRWVWDNQLTYSKSFNDHHLDVTAIQSAQFTKYEYLFEQGEGFGNEEPFNQYLSNASVIRIPQTDVYEDALASTIGRVMYNYSNKYFLSVSMRRDQTSRLAKGNQADYFPSTSLGWRISDEKFFKIPVINDLKLRASWGQIGNINSVGYYSFDVPLNTTTVVLGENGKLDYKGTYAGRQSNPNLKWEISESLDFGLDASLFNNKLSLTADYFEKTTKGMIIPGLEDSHQGTIAADVNGGEVKNTGFEFGIGYKVKSGDFTYSINANASLLDNKLINLDGYNSSGIDYIAHSDNVRSILTPYRSIVGKELYSTYLIPYMGIFQSQAEIEAYKKDGKLIQPNAVPGDFKFQDTNNDGKIDNNDRAFMASYLPDVTYNLNLNFAYKSFDLGMIFQGVAGVKAFNGYKYTTYNASLQGYNLDNRVLDSWTPTNTNTNLPRISTKDDNQNFGTTSSWYLEDASYVRLKNVTLGYTLPKSVMGSSVKDPFLRVYLSAENLFTITPYSGIDPEVGGKGLDVGKYPVSRTITMGLSLSL